MEPSHEIQMPDMNIPCNLEFYRQIIEFDKETTQEITFNSLDRAQQRAVQSIAHSRNLEYEYQKGCARVFRAAISDANLSLLPNADYQVNPMAEFGAEFETWDLNQLLNFQMDELPNLNPITQLQGDPQSRYQPPVSSMDELIPTAIVIKNIPFAFQREHLLDLIVQKGLSLPHALNYDLDNGVFRGLAFAHFTTLEDTSAAIDALNHTEVSGRKLRVEYKRAMPAHERERIGKKGESQAPLQEPHSPPQHRPMSGIFTPIDLFSKLAAFRQDESQEILHFPPGIPPQQRREIYIMAQRLGLHHRSEGTGEYRHVKIYREENMGRGQQQERYPQTNDGNIGDLAAYESIPSLDLRSSESSQARLSRSHNIRRPSVSSLAMSSNEALTDGPDLEDFLTMLSDVPASTPWNRQTSRSNSLMSSMHWSPIASPRMVPADLTGISNRGVTSRSGSVNSMHSDRGLHRVTKSFARSPSAGRFSPGIGESFFSSKPDRLSRRSSSGASGRTGPLDYLARMSMKAVKAIGGACWRCRILGKKCTEENPCDTCPKRNKSGKSAWMRVGCKRGALGEEMEHVVLCPKSCVTKGQLKQSEIAQCHQCNHFWHPREHGSICPRCQGPTSELLEPFTNASEIIAVLDNLNERRKEDTVFEYPSKGKKSRLTPIFQRLWNVSPLVKDLGLSHHFTSTHYSLTDLFPLDQCILAIVWEIVENPSKVSHLSVLGTASQDSLDNLVILLRSAALYQARLEPDPHQLIAQSLICLREALELKRAKSFGAFEPFAHQICSPTAQVCEIQNITDFTSSLSRYIEQLSLVLFKKENLRSKSWWMSVFYSLIIQGFVRRTLLTLFDCSQEDIPATINKYLYLALRLFIASSGDYDPIVRNSIITDFETYETYEAAKISVRRAEWKSASIPSSREFLQRLFGDDGSPIVQSAEPPPFPQPVSFTMRTIDPASFGTY